MSEQLKSKPLQFEVALHHEDDPYEKEESGTPQDTPNAVPSICGLPLKYVSLVTLAVQNAALTLIMHYSRVSAAPSQTYSAAAAVLLVELLKGSISLAIAFARIDNYAPQYLPNGQKCPSSLWNPWTLLGRFRRLGKEVFRADCWKLAIPAILYVIQNNLQFVAVSNLEAATFQVTYQMKILTTAAFSVILLRKKLSPVKWLALLFLAIGVGIVQIQSGSQKSQTDHDMNAFKGFMAVTAACFTSGLAGVYFEMVLKNSPGDLWVRNVQLSLFSLLPALVPVVFSGETSSNAATGLFNTSIFANFGVGAWATVLTQVLGGLLTALVIKYADNILKGFATSLSIVISFLASMAMFHFQMTASFAVGSVVVLVATWMYNQPESSSANDTPARESRPWSWGWRRPAPYSTSRNASAVELTGGLTSRHGSTSSLSSVASSHSRSSSYIHHTPSRSFPTTPDEREAQIKENNTLPRRYPQGQFFAAPTRPTHPLYSLRSQSFSGSSNSSSLDDSVSFPPSRPGSALSSHPSTRPSSALGDRSSVERNS
ncbi:nucleotide-sugar transporter-domain-containing protein [Cytidiella melzeri]|nr:nucleotide-sugar transporter-domain-containing protein [Cytidiella melzeri]